MAETPPDPSRIMQVGMGFMTAKVLMSAVELGLFPALGGGPLPGAALSARLGLHPRGAVDFLDALVALGFLIREGDGPDGRYANTPETTAFLDPAAPAYLGGIIRMASNRLYLHWADLTEALRTGRPQNEGKGQDGTDFFATLYADPARLVGFIDAMASVQAGNFSRLGETYDFAPHRTLCDVGGAGAALSLVLARRHPNLRCVTYDLPAVTAIASARIAAAGLSERIEARAGDFMREALPAADVVTMGNILHDWGTAEKKMLIGKAFAALPEGGVFIVIENIIDDARRENATGLLMSLNMLVETPAGYDYTFAQFDGWCREAGFRRTEKRPLAGAASAALAWK